MTTLYLIRHGHTDYVSQGRLPGWLPGIGLSPEGAAQADRLAELMRRVKLKGVYSSPLERARQTAGPIAQAAGLKLVVRPGLGELRIGSFEGLSLKAARRRKLWAAIQFSPSTARFPGGESFIEAQARIVDTIERLRALHSGRKAAFVCVSHADPIKLAIAHYLGLPLDLFQRLTVAPASISVLNLSGHGARLLSLNDLRATGSAKH